MNAVPALDTDSDEMLPVTFLVPLRIGGAEGAVRKARKGAGPLPTSRPLAEAEVAQHRSLWCRDYDWCLDHAASRAWPSWSCADCQWKGDGDGDARADGQARRGSHRRGSIAL